MPYPSKWGALNQGILNGLQVGRTFSQDAEAKKQRELETAIMKKKMIEEQLADSSIDNNKEYKAGLTKQWNDLNQQIFPGAPVHDGNWDKGDSKVYKNLVNVQKFIEKNNITDRETITKLMNEAYTPADDPKLKSTESKALIEGLSRRNEGFASTTLNKIDTGEAASGDAGAPTYTGAIDTAKAIMPYLDSEGKKRLKEEFDRLGGAYANALAGDFASQPEGSWQREAIQREATTSPYSDPKEFREAQETNTKVAGRQGYKGNTMGFDPVDGREVTKIIDKNGVSRLKYVGDEGTDPSSWASYEKSHGPLTPISLGRTPASEVGKGTMLDTIKGNLDRIKSTKKDDWVGFATGRIKQLQASTVGGLPEDQNQFYADVNDLADMLLRARSGAQINEQEYQRLTRLVPTPNMPPSTFNARLKRFETQIEQVLESQKKRLKQGGYMSPKGTSIAPTTSTGGSKKMTFNPSTGAFE